MSIRFAREALAVALVLALALALGGCSQARGPYSPEIPPPQDPARAEVQQRLRSLMRNAERMLGESYQEYYLGSGDIITITIVGRTDLLGVRSANTNSAEGLTTTITDNPLITLPLIGAVRVHGKTVERFQKDLTEAYSSIAKDPKVVVTVDKYYRRQVTVLGAVSKPGRYPLDFGDTILDALFKSGGLTFTSEGGLPPGRYMKVYREKVTQKQRAELPPESLLRRFREGDGSIIPREEIVVPIEEFILGGNLSYNLPLVPGDVIFIPGAGTVSVQGRVRSPGVVIMGPSLRTLNHAITERGGLEFGADSLVEVVRTRADGSQFSTYIDARDARRRLIPDFLLQDGDQIFIYTHWGRQTLAVIGNIFSATVSTGVNATYSP